MDEIDKQEHLTEDEKISIRTRLLGLLGLLDEFDEARMRRLRVAEKEEEANRYARTSRKNKDTLARSAQLPIEQELVFIDKKEWPRGEWFAEPDRKQWLSHGYDCLIIRHKASGHLCGYLGLPKDHPAYAEVNIDCACSKKEATKIECHHYGLTYGPAPCSDDLWPGAICRNEGSHDDLWWIGFDCSHLGDMSYFTRDSQWPPIHDDGVYRNIQYVTDEVEQLAKQARDLVV